MFVQTLAPGSPYPNAPAYEYVCDGCTASYIFEAPQTVPFTCHSPACGWGMVSIDPVPAVVLYLMLSLHVNLTR
jgi:hypothetical protein